MNFLALTYDEGGKEYSYLISPEAPSNCKILDFKKFSEIDMKGNFVIFIGNVWNGIDIGMSNSLGEIANKYLAFKFYFKLIFDEMELESILPKEISAKSLPIILYINHFEFTVLSSGPILKEQLNNKIDEVLRLGQE